MDKYLNACIVFTKFSRDYMVSKNDLPIRPSEMGLLNVITRWEGDFTPLALAETIGVSKPMIAAHLHALMKKGYVYKEASLEDKRSFYVRPTEAGMELARKFEKKQTERVKEIEARLGEDKFAELTRLLDETQTILAEMQ